MKFSIQSADMAQALSTASHAISARSTLQILEGILIETKENMIEITCSDGAMTICARVQAHVTEEGRIVMPGRLFQDVVRRLPQGEMRFTVGSNMAAVIECGVSRTRIAGQSAELFPRLPSVSETNRVTLPQSALKDMIAKTSFAISVDDSHKILTGCLLEVTPGEARMVALDGFRFAVRRVTVESADTELQAVIPGRLLQEVAKIISDEDDKLLTLIFGTSQIKVEMEDADIYASLLEGEFINYRKIIPQSFNTVCRVLDREQMSQSVERASLIARENKSNIVALNVTKDVISITATSEMGDAKDEFAVESEGEEMDISFNVRYIADVLKAIDDDSFFMKFISPINPCVIEPCEGSDYFYMILPLRTRG